jgi:hypothetical protein
MDACLVGIVHLPPNLPPLMMAWRVPKRKNVAGAYRGCYVRKKKRRKENINSERKVLGYKARAFFKRV